MKAVNNWYSKFGSIMKTIIRQTGSNNEAKHVLLCLDGHLWMSDYGQ